MSLSRHTTASPTNEDGRGKLEHERAKEVTKKDLQMFRTESCRGQDSCYVPGLTEAASHIES